MPRRESDLTGKAGSGRTFVLSLGFVGGALAGAWLGLIVAFFSGRIPSYPEHFPGEDLVAAFVAATALVGLYALVRRTDGWISALVLLFIAAFAALDLLCSAYLLMPLEVLCVVPPRNVEAPAEPEVLLVASLETPPQCRSVAPLLYSTSFAAAMVPAALVAVLLCLAAVRRSVLLQLMGFAMGGLFVRAGLLTLAGALAQVGP